MANLACLPTDSHAGNAFGSTFLSSDWCGPNADDSDATSLSSCVLLDYEEMRVSNWEWLVEDNDLF
jgi:hypothetical protein